MKKANYLWIVALVVGTVLILMRHNRTDLSFKQETGLIFGTIYNVTYEYERSLKGEIEDELHRFDGSLSMFNDTSTISRINKNQDIVPDSFFLNCFQRAMSVSKETNGAFDITVAPLVNAWGFGFKQGIYPDSTQVDSLMQLVGYHKIALNDEGKIVKQDPRMTLDCSAIAKGYAVDVIAQLFRSHGIKNFMVDIGGEVKVEGHNPTGRNWRVGIIKPTDDSLSVNQEQQTVLALTNMGIATSGNYRNYYFRDGKKYAHTIEPRTGYPVQHSILSATVLASDCMSADAYATSFMVMGLGEAVKFVTAHPGIEVCLIYADEQGNFQTYFSSGMRDFIDD